MGLLVQQFNTITANDCELKKNLFASKLYYLGCCGNRRTQLMFSSCDETLKRQRVESGWCTYLLPPQSTTICLSYIEIFNHGAL